MDITVDQVRAFVAVAEHGHFGQAARSLSMTQPPVSRLVQRLEAIVGAPLLTRSSQGAELTGAGKAFLPHALRVLTELEEGAVAARAAAQGRRGRIRLGFTVLAGLSVLGECLPALRSKLPDVEITLREMDSHSQEEALEAGRLDLALVRGLKPGSGLALRRVSAEQLVAAVPRPGSRRTSSV